MKDKSSRYCQACDKAHKACICQLIQPIDCGIPVIILQHPSESNQAIGTARILSLSLSNCQLFVGEDFTHHAELNALLADNDRQYLLLYPADDALTVNEWQQQAKSATTKLGIILLDGTWRKAYKIYQLSKNIQSLPCLGLNTLEKSRYRIRKTSKAAGLATVEAGFYALSQLSHDPQKFMPLMTTFEQMVDFQLSHLPKALVEERYS